MLLSHHTISRSALRRALLSSAVVPLLAMPLAMGHIGAACAEAPLPQAAGGWGGASGDGKAGGVSDPYGGDDGESTGAEENASGGGGGSGAIGGLGGAGHQNQTLFDGGPGGLSAGAAGLPGETGGAGGGGGGGAHGYTDTSGVLPTATATGGAGGAGGDAHSVQGGGGGGGGGFGAVVIDLGSDGTVSNILTGGAGGNGGGSDYSGGTGGNAGGGGAGLFVQSAFASSGSLTLTVAGTLTGGNGGAGGSGSHWGGDGGNGGIGLYYVNNSPDAASLVLVSGTVTGGDGGAGGAGADSDTTGIGGAGGVGIYMEEKQYHADLTLASTAVVSGGWDGSVRANAIELHGGQNQGVTLNLEGDGTNYAEINGNVVADASAAHGLALSGLGGKFDLSKLGGSAQFQNFFDIEVLADSTWTLTGTQAGAVNMAAVYGTLQLGDGAAGAALNFGEGLGLGVLSGGTLAVTAGAPVSITGSILQFMPGSTYAVYVTPTTHSLLTVSGHAILGAAVVVHATDGDYSQVTQPQKILTANGGVVATFSGVTTDYAFLTPTLTYDLNNVYLTLAYDNGGGGGGGHFADYARTYNQRNTANAAEALGEGNGVFDAILVQSQQSVANAFDQLSGDAYPTASTMLTGHALYLRDAVGDRLDSLLDPLRHYTGDTTKAGQADTHSAHVPAALAPRVADPFAPAVWAQGYGGALDLDGDGNAAGLSATAGGLFVGLDASLTDQVRAGLVGGISRTSFDVDGRGSSGSADTYELGAYAGGRLGLFGFKAGASHAWNDVSMDRTIAFPSFSGSTSADYDQSTTQIFGEVNAAFAAGRVDVEPFAALAYVHLSDADFTETGSTPAALSGHLDALDTVYSTLGVRAATSFQLGGRTFSPSATLGWQHASGDLTPEAAMRFAGASTPFSVAGVPVARDAALIGAGLSWDLSDRAGVKADYLGHLASDVSDNSFTARFSLKF